MQTETTGAAVQAAHNHDADYNQWLERMRLRVQLALANPDTPLFTTERTGSLFTTFLSALPKDQQQYHNCNACHQFISRFGHLVTINLDGTTTPLCWDAADAPGIYTNAARQMADHVLLTKVTGVFLSDEKRWGIPATGQWTHFSITPPAHVVHDRKRPNDYLRPANQVAAEKAEDFKNMNRALGEYLPHHTTLAVQLLEADTLYRAEKVIGPARFLNDLHQARATVKNRQCRDNILWHAVALAPPGFCHPRSSMVGTLLDDLVAGKSFTEASAAFKAKMDPLKYQRPVAPPKAGAIEQAEKAFKEMGLEGALARRHATLDDLVKLWTPAPPKPQASGSLFAHLKKPDPAPMSMRVPAQTITWVKFRDTVLPTAAAIRANLSTSFHLVNFVTAVDPDAPPIVQWDRPGDRNPVTWSCPSFNVGPHAIGLRSNTLVDVPALVELPHMWDKNRDFSHQGEGVVVVLDGAKPTHVQGLFPEHMRAELHGVRSVLEAHFRQYSTVPQTDGACGIDIRKGEEQSNTHLEVTDNSGLVREFKIDRWD